MKNILKIQDDNNMVGKITYKMTYVEDNQTKKNTIMSSNRSEHERNKREREKQTEYFRIMNERCVIQNIKVSHGRTYAR